MISFVRLLTCGVILSLAVASPFERLKRQIIFPDENQEQVVNPGPTQTPQGTTPASTPRTTPSQAYFRCLERCRTTNEYNPVCGDDGQNYQNMQRLACAQNCGAQVQFVRRGTCLPL